MTIGAALLLIAAGAVLRFAISTSSVGGVNLYIIGDILMGVGAFGLLLWLVIWLPRSRRRRAVYEPPPDVPRAREPKVRLSTTRRAGTRESATRPAATRMTVTQPSRIQRTSIRADRAAPGRPAAPA